MTNMQNDIQARVDNLKRMLFSDEELKKAIEIAYAAGFDVEWIEEILDFDYRPLVINILDSILEATIEDLSVNYNIDLEDLESGYIHSDSLYPDKYYDLSDETHAELQQKLTSLNVQKSKLKQHTIWFLEQIGIELQE